VILWLDAQVSPKLCPWIGREFEVDVVPVRDLGLREAEDPQIFDEARRAKAVVLTKDEDFVILVQRLGPPPQVIWLTCGNVSNARLKKILTAGLPEAIAMIQRGEQVVEITAGQGRRGGRARPTRRSRRRRKARRA
jgi:predicted nuclease of predicted toxin-antitoxin system